MGWTVAEGSRFSGSTPPPPRPPAIRPRKRGYLNSLAGLSLVPGGRRIDQPAPRGHGRGQLRRMLRALRFPVHRRAPGMAPGRAGNARGHHRAPPRRPLMGEGGRQAQRHRAPHSYRRPLDTAGRPPGPPGARSRARAGSVITTLRPRTGRLTHDSGVTAEPPPGVPARWPPRRYARSCFRPNQAHSRCPPQHPPRPPHRRREAPAPPFVNP